MAKTTEASKCNKLADEVVELQKKITALREKFEAIDQEKLDAEEDPDWDSDVVNEYIMDLETAENAMEGII